MFFNKNAINEAYFGKTGKILFIEKKLDAFRKKHMEKYVFNYNINSDPELLEIDRLFEKLFNFECVTIHIHKEPICNAFTMPIDARFDYFATENVVRKSEDGFRIKRLNIKNAYGQGIHDFAVLIGVYSGIIFNPGFTTAEVMAIILHVLGHNFNSYLNLPTGIMNSCFNMAYMIISACSGVGGIDILKNTNSYRLIADKLGKDWREKKIPLIYWYDAFMQVVAILKSGVHTVTDAIRILSMGSLTLVTGISNGLLMLLQQSQSPVGMLFNALNLLFRYRSEEVADNFATMYGYGADLTSALNKMETQVGASPSALMAAFDRIPVVSSLMHITEIPAYMLLSAIDEHPHSITRATDQIDLLERELQKKNLDPKMRKRIEQDIKETRAAIDVMCDCTEGLNDPYIGRKLYNVFMTNAIPVKKSIFGTKDKFEQYDKIV